MDYDILIVGAGLAGLTAALRLSERGLKPALVDYALPQSEGDLGGFAKFSGAKFSLPPAGMGLSPIAGGERELSCVIGQVLGYLDIGDNQTEDSKDQSDSSIFLRTYQSILLTPKQITNLVRRLEENVKKSGVQIYRGTCEKITANESSTRAIISTPHEERVITTKKLVYAGGRLGTKVLKKAGIKTTPGKGIDVGVRVEFFDPEGLKALRALGPDAKIIKGACRTFCLNFPGEIYKYDFEHLRIPGGIVAGANGKKSNVGLLLRLENKDQVISELIENTKSLNPETFKNGIRAENEFLGAAQPILDQIIGKSRRIELEDFGQYLQEQGLVDWRLPHDVHLPLIDWHWDTFAKHHTFQTSDPSIYCIGDASGHARGLLQAAISGYLVAEDLANELQ